jgi:hypothetical protein
MRLQPICQPLTRLVTTGLGGDPNKIEHDGYYDDTYEKTPQGWRFKSRVQHATYIPGNQK